MPYTQGAKFSLYCVTDFRSGDAGLFKDFTCLFQKNLTFGMAGTGTLGSVTTLTISAYDGSGKLVFYNGYVGKSKDTEAVVGGIYDFGKFQELTDQATADALQKFATDLAAR